LDFFNDFFSFRLAFNKTEKHDQIIQHKLNIDPLGDLDFKHFFETRNNTSARSYHNLDNLNIFEKKKLSRLMKNSDSSGQVSNSQQAEMISLEEISKNKDVNGKPKKPKINKNSSTKSKKTLFQTKPSKYEEIKDTSIQSAMSPFNRQHQQKQTANLNDTTESQINPEWSLISDRVYDDSENEQVPLVSNKKISNHQKKKSNLSNILIGTNPSSKTSAKESAKDSPSNSIRLNKVTSNPSGSLQIDCGGNENEAFNETGFN
jgi:hypothetical protein